MPKKTRTPINEIKAFVPRPEQLSKARELLGWSTAVAAEKAKITTDDLAILESDPRGGPGLMALELAYRDVGVTFGLWAGPSGQIFKTKLGEGPWHIFTRRGPRRIRSLHDDE